MNTELEPFTEADKLDLARLINCTLQAWKERTTDPREIALLDKLRLQTFGLQFWLAGREAA